MNGWTTGHGSGRPAGRQRVVRALGSAAWILPLGWIVWALVRVPLDSLPPRPDANAQLYAASASAQVGATVLGLLVAGLLLTLSRPGLPLPEFAVDRLIHSRKTLAVFATLVPGTLLSLGIPLFIDAQRPSATASATALAAVLVGAGLLATAAWLVSVPDLLSIESIIDRFLHSVPAGWADAANSLGREQWRRAFDKAQADGRRPPLFPTEPRAGSLPGHDPVVLVLDALASWIASDQRRPLPSQVEEYLRRLESSMAPLQSPVAEWLLPRHLLGLLRSALGSGDLQMIYVVLDWIERVHRAWQARGVGTVRPNHWNWLMPPMLAWTRDTDLGPWEMELLTMLFRSAADPEPDRATMSIAGGHFLRFLLTLMERGDANSASTFWTEIDLYLRGNGPRSNGIHASDLRYIGKRAGELKLVAFGMTEEPVGFLRDWIALSLFHAAKHAVDRSGGPDHPETQWAGEILTAVRSMYAVGEEPIWQSQPVARSFPELGDVWAETTDQATVETP